MEGELLMNWTKGHRLLFWGMIALIIIIATMLFSASIYFNILELNEIGNFTLLC